MAEREVKNQKLDNDLNHTEITSDWFAQADALLGQRENRHEEIVDLNASFSHNPPRLPVRMGLKRRSSIVSGAQLTDSGRINDAEIISRTFERQFASTTQEKENGCVRTDSSSESCDGSSLMESQMSESSKTSHETDGREESKKAVATIDGSWFDRADRVLSNFNTADAPSDTKSNNRNDSALEETTLERDATIAIQESLMSKSSKSSHETDGRNVTIDESWFDQADRLLANFNTADARINRESSNTNDSVLEETTLERDATIAIEESLMSESSKSSHETDGREESKKAVATIDGSWFDRADRLLANFNTADAPSDTKSNNRNDSALEETTLERDATIAIQESLMSKSSETSQETAGRNESKKAEATIDGSWFDRADRLLANFNTADARINRESSNTNDSVLEETTLERDTTIAIEESLMSESSKSSHETDGREESKKAVATIDGSWFDRADRLLANFNTADAPSDTKSNNRNDSALEETTLERDATIAIQESLMSKSSETSQETAGRNESKKAEATIDGSWFDRADRLLANFNTADARINRESSNTNDSVLEETTLERDTTIAIEESLMSESSKSRHETDGREESKKAVATIDGRWFDRADRLLANFNTADAPSDTKSNNRNDSALEETTLERDATIAIQESLMSKSSETSQETAGRNESKKAEATIDGSWFDRADRLLANFNTADARINRESSNTNDSVLEETTLERDTTIAIEESLMSESSKSRHETDGREESKKAVATIDGSWFDRADRLLANFNTADAPSDTKSNNRNDSALEETTLERDATIAIQQSLMSKSNETSQETAGRNESKKAVATIDGSWFDRADRLLANFGTADPPNDAKSISVLDETTSARDATFGNHVIASRNNPLSSSGARDQNGLSESTHHVSSSHSSESTNSSAHRDTEGFGATVEGTWFEKADRLLSNLNSSVVPDGAKTMSIDDSAVGERAQISSPNRHVQVDSAAKFDADEKVKVELDPDWLRLANAALDVISQASEKPSNDHPNELTVDNDNESRSLASALTDDNLWDLDTTSVASGMKSNEQDSDSDELKSIMSSDLSLGIIDEEESSSNSSAESETKGDPESNTSGALRNQAFIGSSLQPFSANETESQNSQEELTNPVQNQPTVFETAKVERNNTDLWMPENPPSPESKSPREDEGTKPRDDDSALTGESEISLDQSKNTWLFRGLILLGIVVGCLVIFAVPWLVRKDSSSNAAAPEPGNPFVPFIPFSPPSTSPQVRPTSQSFLLWDLELTIDGNGAGGFGSVVESGHNKLIIGEPLEDKFTSLRHQSETGLWSEDQEVFHDELGVSFGVSASKIAQNRVVIGAPASPFYGTDVPVGSAAVFTSDSSSKRWQRLGSLLTGDANVDVAANENFGRSVAISEVLRVAVGAPGSNLAGPNAGRVYTFELDIQSMEWNQLEPFPLFGEEAGDSFGSAVALSGDGLTLFVGSPGSADGGYVQIFQWLNGDWKERDILRASSDDEAFGTSIEIVNENADYVIVGAPNYKRNQGRVTMFKRNPLTELYSQLGDDIEGDPGSFLGMDKGIAAFDSPYGIHVAALSRNGEAIRIDYSFAESKWNNLFSPVDIPLSDRNSIAMFTNNNVDNLVVGIPSEEQIRIYSTKSLANAAATYTSAPSNISANQPSKAPIGTVSSTLAPTELSSKPVQSIFQPSEPTKNPSKAPMAVTIPAPILPNPPSETTGRPTQSPSIALNTDLSWVEVGGPYRISQAETGYGRAVSITSDVMVVGAPLGVDVGVVLSFERRDDGYWNDSPSQQLGGSQVGSQFGFATDMNDQILLIGAPEKVNDATLVRSGSASCYARSNGSWTQLGFDLYGTANGFGADEKFGAAVAVSDVNRIAVAAPESMVNTEQRHGRVYTFDYNVGSSEWVKSSELVGRSEGDEFGKSLDLSPDGRYLVVGSPGNRAGFATVYHYSSNAWLAVSRIIGQFDNEGTGSSVCFLRADGSIVAVGSPSFEQGKGRIFVYERIALTGRFSPLGEPLVGGTGERFGASNKLAGTVGAGLNLLVGTTFGLVKTFSFDSSSNTWRQIVDSADTGYRSRTGLLSLAAHSDIFAVGGNDAASIFQTVEG